MGKPQTPFSRLLKRAMLHASMDGTALARLTGIGRPDITKYRSGTTTPGSVDIVAKLSDALNHPLRPMLVAWICSRRSDDGLSDPRLVDRVEAALQHGGATDSQAELETKVAALSYSRKLKEAAATVVAELGSSASSLHHTAHRILDALATVPATRVAGGRLPRDVRAEHFASWSPLMPGSRIRMEMVFCSGKPAPVVAALHHFPPRVGGLHREPCVGAREPGHELWCVVSGRAVLALQKPDGSAWSTLAAAPGMAGSYWAGQRHAWINMDAASGFTVFHVSYPLGAPLSLDGPGELLEFELDRLPDSVDAPLRQLLDGLGLGSAPGQQ